MLSTPVRRSGVLAAGAASSTVGNPSSGSGFSSTRIEHQLWDLATSGSVEIGEVVAATPSSGTSTATSTSTSTTASASRLEILAKSTAKTSGSKYRYRGYNSTTCMHEFVLLIPKSQQPTPGSFGRKNAGFAHGELVVLPDSPGVEKEMKSRMGELSKTKQLQVQAEQEAQQTTRKMKRELMADASSHSAGPDESRKSKSASNKSAPAINTNTAPVAGVSARSVLQFDSLSSSAGSVVDSDCGSTQETEKMMKSSMKMQGKKIKGKAVAGATKAEKAVGPMKRGMVMVEEYVSGRSGGTGSKSEGGRGSKTKPGAMKKEQVEGCKKKEDVGASAKMIMIKQGSGNSSGLTTRKTLGVKMTATKKNSKQSHVAKSKSRGTSTRAAGKKKKP
eukprot:CAMPEP_0178988848 /NCGR_PEP_ID=MMETSP0795-20121207/4029_1 /TAXON_ID=88552 /ORGANISM="Amoebophrya sp., Strain Ameob2" /LENGTH=389 /DNA_ID=CAMNT_0020680149 /DNA_START=135 /DNA_END=1304 /DNA_ORIENTATION=+